MADLSKKRIIMIHGLASKPPKEDTHLLWKKALIENIRIDNPNLASDLDNSPDVFESAYWANEIPSHIEDDADYIKQLEKQVDLVIKERKDLDDDFHVGENKVKNFFKSRALDLVDILAGSLTIKDDVMKKFLVETKLYNEDQYIADNIRKPLENALKKAWDEEREVVLISHSMGTFISYDVLWRFSHRNYLDFFKYRDKRVRMFVTMGSPLGNTAIKDLLFSKFHRKYGIRQFPTNIDYWHNYACLGDVVSHDAELADDYFEPMKKYGLLKANKFSCIDYKELHNPFVVVSHEDNQGKNKRNPHKSYGYLIQPRLGTWIGDFLLDRLN